MEDVELVRRIGGRNLVGLAAIATTSASRYRRDGYARRILRNLSPRPLSSRRLAAIDPASLCATYGKVPLFPPVPGL
jgi:hypothetical protein